jgi:predicted nucleic-acid-binding Zn-ribbon protein
MSSENFKIICPKCGSDNVDEYSINVMGRVYIVKECECGYKEEKSY